jgi:hypothetical protein
LNYAAKVTYETLAGVEKQEVPMMIHESAFESITHITPTEGGISGDTRPLRPAISELFSRISSRTLS